MLCAWHIGVMSKCDCGEIMRVKVIVCEMAQNLSESGCDKEWVWSIRWEGKMNKIKKQK